MREQPFVGGEDDWENGYCARSEISEESRLFRAVRIVDSLMAGRAEIADFARVYGSSLFDSNRVGRASLIYSSTLGRHTYTGNNTVVMHSDIGNFSSLSWNVTIGSANHDYSRLTTHDFLYNEKLPLRPNSEKAIYDRFEKRTIIGHDVWVGAGAIVMNGVTVGNGAVIGANATVTKDVAPYAIVVGSPARVIKSRFDIAIVTALQDLEWWSFADEVIREIYPLMRSDVSLDLVRDIERVKNEYTANLRR